MATGNPDFVAYTVRDRGVDRNGEKRDPFWLRIGAAFAHERGEGFNIVLDALPIDGRIVLRKPKESDE
ncbi:MAG: hypothetical protein GC150_17680 [Rhizobiales bacterium]|nr:hypothetical protein [Hyphomicrobiales bacterium]